MRIITGFARGTKLLTPEGEDTRPTSEKVKEAIFSAIQFEIPGRLVLDLFAGSGQMALEALSRGAEKATIVDNAKRPIELIKENAKKTRLMDKCVIVNSDWKDFLNHAKPGYNLVFLDPPYKAGILDEALTKLAEKNLLGGDAIVISESDIESLPKKEFSAEKSRKNYRYGRTYVTVIKF